VVRVRVGRRRGGRHRHRRSGPADDRLLHRRRVVLLEVEPTIRTMGPRSARYRSDGSGLSIRARHATHLQDRRDLIGTPFAPSEPFARCRSRFLRVYGSRQ